MPHELDIPEYLKISEADRKAAWDGFREARPLKPEKPDYRRITDIPEEPKK